MGPADDASNYTKQSKKQYIFTFLAEAVIMLCFLGYFVSVVNEYVDLMNKKYQDEEKAEKERKAAEKEAAKNKK